MLLTPSVFKVLARQSFGSVGISSLRRGKGGREEEGGRRKKINQTYSVPHVHYSFSPMDNIAPYPGLETSHVMRMYSIVKHTDTPCYGCGLP